ncbi:hypothetical protein VTI74DRAFT_4610 [Chaetomium olivicolor]
MLLYTRLAPPKQPKRRSRGGCTYCKEKKKKCDEKRPKCSRCTEHGADCAYEAVKPRQRKRRETVSLAEPGSPATSPFVSRRLSDVSHFSHDADYLVRDHGILRGLLPFSHDDPVLLSPTETMVDSFPLAAFSPSAFLDSHEEDGVSKENNQTSTSTEVVPRSKSLHPDLAMIAPCPVGSPLLDFCSPIFSEFSDQQNRRALVDHFCNVLSHLIVFREETGNPFQQLVLPLTRPSSPVTYAIFALACAHLEYRGVENAEKSLYFHNMAIRGVAQLIEHSSKVSRNEILAAIMLLVYYECLVQKGQSNIVAGHLKGALTIMGTVPDPADSTSIFLERAFRFYDVITALSNGTPPLSAAPTPGCLMPLSPLGAPSTSPLGNVDTLLGMATTLWPIIHRLAGLRALKNELETAVRTNASPSKVAVLRTEFESTAQAIETALLSWRPQLPPGFVPEDIDPAPSPAAHSTADPPIIAAAAAADNDDDDDTTTIPTTPSQQQQSPSPSPPPLSSSSSSSTKGAQASLLSSIHHNALAYRHASLVYLYRVLLSQARTSATVQSHTHLALAHCVATVQHKGPMSALLWPLFVSACEAVTEEDRALAEQAFVEVEKRQGMRNIERAWGILGEVWRRGDLERLGGKEARGECGCVGGDVEEEDTNEQRDDEQGEELWRKVCREMGVSIVFG